jgi:hypothetical protein
VQEYIFKMKTRQTGFETGPARSQRESNAGTRWYSLPQKEIRLTSN